MSAIDSPGKFEHQYNKGFFAENKLEKIDALVYSDDLENIRNG